MSYLIKIPEMHCSGCVALIEMVLEEKFSNVNVNLDTKHATFESEQEIKGVKNILDTLFKEELNENGYTFIELKQI